ncbi:MAG: sigma-70 family RNA polymerase sigma factor [Nitriliruptorales bacterium]|nr:sigma-70 family RNA polymerase sigma factor [Nitriliruptorales bacterium]
MAGACSAERQYRGARGRLCCQERRRAETRWQATDASSEDFTRVAREQLPRLYSLARHLVDDQAEDLVQECLLKAFRGFGRLRDHQAAPAWLTTILVNCARDRFRTGAHRPQEAPLGDVEDFSLYRQIAVEDPFPYSDSLHLDFLCRFGPEDVWAVLRTLPEPYRVPLMLVHMEDLPTKQVARLLELPLGTLLSRLHRGRKLFERELWEYAVRHDLLKTAFQKEPA